MPKKFNFSFSDSYYWNSMPLTILYLTTQLPLLTSHTTIPRLRDLPLFIFHKLLDALILLNNTDLTGSPTFFSLIYSDQWVVSIELNKVSQKLMTLELMAKSNMNPLYALCATKIFRSFCLWPW